MKNGFDMKTNAFEVVSGKLFVSDPCYDLDTWCAYHIPNAKKGVWRMESERDDRHGLGMRNVEIVAHHVDHTPMSHEYRLGFDQIGVDSGQAGIFDAQFFKDDELVDGIPHLGEFGICSEAPWYSLCCDRTLYEGENNENPHHVCGAGVVPYGCVSSSGFGDGRYECFVIEKDGKIVAVKIVFLTDDEDEDDVCPDCGNFTDLYGECSYCNEEDEEDDDDSEW